MPKKATKKFIISSPFFSKEGQLYQQSFKHSSFNTDGTDASSHLVFSTFLLLSLKLLTFHVLHVQTFSKKEREDGEQLNTTICC